MEELILSSDSVVFTRDYLRMTVEIAVTLKDRMFIKIVPLSELKYLNDICKQLKYELTKLLEVK